MVRGGLLKRERYAEKYKTELEAKAQAEEQAKREAKAEEVAKAKEEEKAEQKESFEKAEEERIAAEKEAAKKAYEEEQAKIKEEEYQEYLKEKEALEAEELKLKTTFTQEEDARIKALETSDYDAWKQAKTLAEEKDKRRYSGTLGGIKITKGKVDPGQDLSNYNVDYYDDGTIRSLRKDKKTYYRSKYGGKREDYTDYYQNQFEFHPDGSIKKYQKLIDYKDSKGKAGRTSYYGYRTGVAEKYNFADDDGIISSYNKYERKRDGREDWDLKNVYTANYLEGQKAKEIKRQWSTSKENWSSIEEKDLITGKRYVDKSFSDLGPKTDPTKGKEVVSSRVIYKPHPTQPGGLIPDYTIATYEGGEIKVVKKGDMPEYGLKGEDKVSYFRTGSGEAVSAGEVAIPELGILSYKAQIEQKLLKGEKVDYKSPKFKRKEYQSSLVIPEFKWSPTKEFKFVEDRKKFEYKPTVKDPFKYVEVEEKIKTKDGKPIVFLKEGEMLLSTGKVVNKAKYLAEQAEKKRLKEAMKLLPKATRSKIVIDDPTGRQVQAVTYRGYSAKKWFDPVTQEYKTIDPKLVDDKTRLVKRKVGGVIKETQAKVTDFRYTPKGEQKKYVTNVFGTPEQVYLSSMTGAEKQRIMKAEDTGRAISDYLSSQFIKGQESRNIMAGKPRITRQSYAAQVLKESDISPGQAKQLMQYRQTLPFRKPQTYTPQPTYTPAPAPQVFRTSTTLPTISGLAKSTKEAKQQAGGMPPWWYAQKKWSGPIGGQNIGNKIKDYASEFKKKAVSKTKMFTKGL